MTINYCLVVMISIIIIFYNICMLGLWKVLVVQDCMYKPGSLFNLYIIIIKINTGAILYETLIANSDSFKKAMPQPITQ